MADKTENTGNETAFELITDFEPKGDQPKAIEELTRGIRSGTKYQTLLGVTGSGKTFTVANAIEYFVSYYDYYQPEAYVPASDTYIEKDASINDEIDKLRHSTTHSILTRRDVIVVASVSCIYGIGSPHDYGAIRVYLEKGMSAARDEVIKKLVEMRYERCDYDFYRGSFRLRGDVVEVFPSHEGERAIRIEFFGDEVEGLSEIDPMKGNVVARLNKALIHPASHFVTTSESVKTAVGCIREERRERLSG